MHLMQQICGWLWWKGPPMGGYFDCIRHSSEVAQSFSSSATLFKGRLGAWRFRKKLPFSVVAIGSHVSTFLGPFMAS